MELSHMKISDVLLEPDFDFLRFPKHKTVGGKIHRPGYLHPPPPCIPDMPCNMLLGLIK